MTDEPLEIKRLRQAADTAAQGELAPGHFKIERHEKDPVTGELPPDGEIFLAGTYYFTNAQGDEEACEFETSADVGIYDPAEQVEMAERLVAMLKANGYVPPPHPPQRTPWSRTGRRITSARGLLYGPRVIRR